MSSKLFGDDITFLQKLLKCSGLYNGKLDGIWGSKTDAAVTAFEASFTAIAAAKGTFDPRSESSIHTLQSKAQELARVSLKVILGGGFNARIISGTRTYEEQNKIYAQGRFGKPGPIVTNARGGQSNHNFGIAWDIGIFSSTGQYLGNSPLYATAGKLATAAGISNLEWGGNWVTFKDQPHYQHATGLNITQVRTKFDNGNPII